MSVLDGWRHVLRSVVRRHRADDETREELAYHLYRQTEKHMARLTRDEAARRAALELGAAERWREETAASRRGTALFHLAGDARITLRALAARPGFSLSAIATTAIGIGAAVAIFALTRNAYPPDLQDPRDPPFKTIPPSAARSRACSEAIVAGNSIAYLPTHS